MKNVLLVLVDDLRQQLGHHGTLGGHAGGEDLSFMRTPHLDELVKTSAVSFRNAHVSIAVCAPADPCFGAAAHLSSETCAMLMMPLARGAASVAK
jgi:arylsulfatase A-like enzyme